MQRRTQRNVGLARALSKLGYCSRSQACELIRAGRVRVNGTVRRDIESAVHLGEDKLTVDQIPIRRPDKIYLMLNKPRGLITTASDEKGRETIYSLLQGSAEALPWIAPVGRLDKASEGLLLLTNDSEWGAAIAAPETHLEKIYHVQIDSLASSELITRLESGIRTGGETLRASRAKLIRSGESNCWLEIALEEGRNRQIRRMLEALGIEVLRLVRVSIGPLQLGTLLKGSYRHLTAEEKEQLDRAMASR